MHREWPPESAGLAVQMDSCQYLYLSEISEPRDNCLRLLIEEATALTGEVDTEIAGPAITRICPIESTESSRLFEMIWDDYIAYSVQNESYASTDEGEVFTGKRIRVYSKSNFLAFVKQSTFATDEYPGPYQHVQVVCLNHIVDVAATKPPKIAIFSKRREDRPPGRDPS